MTNIRINDLSMFFAESGAGPAVIAVHCSSASHREWGDLAEVLGDRYRVIRPDLIGYGKSERWPEGKVFDPKADAKVIVGLAEQVEGKVHLVGHSYGAAMALEAAVMLGDRVKSMTLIEPVSFHLLRPGGREDAWNEVYPVAKRVQRLVAEGKRGKAAGVYMGYWIGRLRWFLMPRKARRSVIATVDKVALEFEAAEVTVSLDVYRGIAAPTRLIVGTRTRRSAAAVIDVLSGVLPNVETREIAGAGHMSPFTHRDAVTALVVEHIDRSAAD